MAHNRQAGATAEALAAENIELARAVTRMAAFLRWIVKIAPESSRAAFLLDREREAIEAAARVWPPKGE